MSLPFTHLTSALQLTPEVLEAVFPVAKQMEEQIQTKGRGNALKDKVIAILFYEPSTRTYLSFQSAAEYLEAGTITAVGKEGSSFTKGESIEDTIRMAMGYSDLIIMRHPEDGSAERAAAVCNVPFINGGDGGNQHPTQALLDAYTIWKRMGRLDNLKIAFGWDPKHSRTVRSLATVLSQYPGNHFTFVGPESLMPNDDLKQVLEERGVNYEETTDITKAVEGDIAYINRLNNERFADATEFEKLRKEYTMTPKLLEGSNTLVMCPLPRIDDIDESTDKTENAIYFEQAKNGVPVRMALLKMMLT